MKATHSGECQICGSRQLLPGDVLSKHGYTVKWGFFSGVCAGSGQKPFEVSTDLIADAIQNIEKQIVEVSAKIADLENIDSEINGKETAMQRLYGNYMGYHWATVKVVNFQARDARCPGEEKPFWIYSADAIEDKPDAKAKKIETYCKSFPSVRHFVHHLNSEYAKELRRQNSSRRDWITWQTGRLANWAPKPLTPRAAK